MYLMMFSDKLDTQWPWPTFQGHIGYSYKILVNMISWQVFDVEISNLHHICILQISLENFDNKWHWPTFQGHKGYFSDNFVNMIFQIQEIFNIGSPY